MAARNIKQTMRDRRAHKKNKKTGDEESYATWSKRQKDKIKETTSWRLKAKYEFILKTTLNWDKTTDKKDEERDNMAQSLINLAIKGDDDLADAIDILKNIGGSKKHIAEISNYVNDKPSQAKMNKMKDKISELFHKRE
jgi:N-acetylglucosamine kinase-like BadF-type ATPase